MLFPGRYPSAVYIHVRPPTICVSPDRDEYSDLGNLIEKRFDRSENRRVHEDAPLVKLSTCRRPVPATIPLSTSAASGFWRLPEPAPPPQAPHGTSGASPRWRCGPTPPG